MTYHLRLWWQPASCKIGEWWWAGAEFKSPVRALADETALPPGVASALRGEIDRAVSKLLPCRNFLRLIVAAANRVAAAWGLATIDGLVGSTLEIHIEPGDLRTIGGRKWARIIRRERSKRLRNRCLDPLDTPHVRIRSDATTIVVRMGEKTSLLRGTP